MAEEGRRMEDGHEDEERAAFSPTELASSSEEESKRRDGGRDGRRRKRRARIWMEEGARARPSVVGGPDEEVGAMGPLTRTWRQSARCCRTM